MKTVTVNNLDLRSRFTMQKRTEAQWASMIINMVMVTYFVGWLSWVCYISSIRFQSQCDIRCGNRESITPIVGLHETCFCHDGHGKWERADMRE
jgi:hypothetical protein